MLPCISRIGWTIRSWRQPEEYFRCIIWDEASTFFPPLPSDRAFNGSSNHQKLVYSRKTLSKVIESSRSPQSENYCKCPGIGKFYNLVTNKNGARCQRLRKNTTICNRTVYYDRNNKKNNNIGHLYSSIPCFPSCFSLQIVLCAQVNLFIFSYFTKTLVKVIPPPNTVVFLA